jgi:hypothetical protein
MPAEDAFKQIPNCSFEPASAEVYPRRFREIRHIRGFNYSYDRPDRATGMARINGARSDRNSAKRIDPEFSLSLLPRNDVSILRS